MTLQVRTVRVDPDDSDSYTLDGFPLGAAGDEGGSAVVLAELELDSTIGAENFEITNSEDLIAEVGGRTYAVGLAIVRRDGRLDDKLVFFGVPTDYTIPEPEAEDEVVE